MLMATAMNQKGLESDLKNPLPSGRGEVNNLEVANTPSQQAHGLMYRHRLSANQGMLFLVHPPRKARLWMKNMDIPLDMIFLRRSMVIAIASEVPPCQSKPCPVYGPDALVDQVIELRGGRSLELGIRVGSKIDTLRVR